MYVENGSAKGSDLKAQSLERYSSREGVTSKWISINKRLNSNKSSREYNAIVIEAMSISELVIQNVLKEEFVEGRFTDNLNRLMEKGCPITNDEFYKLKRIKWYRNMAANSTETLVQEIINYNSAKDTLITIGRLLFRLGVLSEEDIIPAAEKLQANVGEVIGETCMLQELIGQGGSGRVFKAYHKRLDLTVAVKEIDHRLLDTIDVENEKNMLLSLRHNGIPRIYDIIEDNQTYYLVMDYIEGQTLKEYVEKMGRLPVGAVIRLTRELCDIMDYLHNFNRGIIFRDLKPGNIMLDRETHIHLIDFGISKNAGIKENGGNVYSGTTCYSSPEQLNGGICDKKSDIYSLGGVIYYMTEGVNPATEGEQSYRRSTPEGIINIIERAMAKDREFRYNNISEIVQDMDNLESKLRADMAGRHTNFEYNGQNVNNDIYQDKIQGASPYRPDQHAQNTRSKMKYLIIVPVSAVAVLLLMFLSIFGYNLLKNSMEDNNKNMQSDAQTNKIAGTGNTANDQAVKPSQTQDSLPQTDSKTISDTTQSNDEYDASTAVQVDVSATAFNGKAVLSVSSYQIDGTNLIVNGAIENNYSKEFTISPYDIYVMGDNGNKFSLDIYSILQSGSSTSDIVPGEKRNFQFVFTNYTDSSSLTLNVSRVYCDFTNAKFSLKLK